VRARTLQWSDLGFKVHPTMGVYVQVRAFIKGFATVQRLYFLLKWDENDPIVRQHVLRGIQIALEKHVAKMQPWVER